MRSSVLYFLAILFFASQILASSQDQSPPLRTGTLSTLNLGVRYNSMIMHRGVNVYDGFQLNPFVVAFFLDDRIEFLGDSIGFRDFIWNKTLRYRVRALSVSDTPFIPSDKKIEERGTNREDTFEIANGLEFFLPAYDVSYLSELSVTHYKDVKAHRGQFFEFQAKLKLFDFHIPGFEPLLQPNFVVTTGFGDHRHNKYAYGVDRGSDRPSYYSVGLWIAVPEQADRFFPNVQVTYFETTGNYRNGVFSQGRDQGVLVGFILSESVQDWVKGLF